MIQCTVMYYTALLYQSTMLAVSRTRDEKREKLIRRKENGIDEKKRDEKQEPN